MKKSKNLITVLLILGAFSLSLLGFKDTGNITLIDGKIIKVGPEAMYLKGTINLKFKNDVKPVSMSTFGISGLDNIFSQYKVNDVIQSFPLNPNLSKRKIGDEELAKIYRVNFEANIDPFEFANIVLQNNSAILDWAEPSFVMRADYMPNDPSVGAQWHIAKISSYQAWDLNQGDTTITIGIVDSGTDLDHPDLAANQKRNWAENPTNGVDDDANGYIDDWHGWDFYYGYNDPDIKSNGNDHGSHVGGCASQVTNNGVHGAGIGFKVKILNTKHTDDVNPLSSLYYTDNGIMYCYQNGAKVINCSFGSSYYSAQSQLIINNAWANGTVVCGSAGNGDANGVGQEWARYPASYDNVVSVAATNSSDIKTTFSNYHSTVDISAPGQAILSTLFNNSYASLDGTSMSSPITAGTVALIRSKYPSFTPQQAVDRLKLGVDSIYNLNPTYVGKLGTGRVNAFKCLSDNPIVKIVSVMHTDSVYGNNDKVYDVNEVIPIAVTFKNTHFAGTNSSIRITSADPDIEIVQDSVFVGNIPAYNNFSTTYSNTFKVKAKSTCTFDKDITFKISNSNSCYADESANTIIIRFMQGFATHNVNNLKLSLTKDGAVGKKAQAYGNGLLLGTSSNNNIFEGGLLIGTSNTKVSDVCRRGYSPANASDTDFVSLEAYRLFTPGTISNQDGSGSFNDNGAASNKIGVTVYASSYAFTSVNDQNFILLKYRVKNTSGASLSNIYVAQFIYFQPNGLSNDNNAVLDTTNKLGYCYNNTTPDTYLGLSLMTNQTLNFKAVNVTSEVLNGWTTQEKWDAISNGISSPSYGPGRAGVVVSAGPFSLANNQEETIGFAVVAANNLADLKLRTIGAKTKFTSIGIQQISSEIPTKYEIGQNYPNPFNPETKIKFAIPKNDFVKIKVYDILGKEVRTLVNDKLSAGWYEVSFNGANLSSGLYFYRIETSGMVETKKMLLVK